jgi:CheY-like chemotaxis protein
MAGKPKKTILLVDDDRSLLVTLSDFLKFEGYDVVTADSGEEGLKRLESAVPDLIILDMSMPGMGGVGFLKAISLPDGRLKHRVLVLTARANMAEFFANVDVDGFVAKPCDPNDLLMEVGRIIFLRGTREETKSEEGQPRKILLGEDDADASTAIESKFGRAGFVVCRVQKEPEVLEKAILEQPDVILLKLVLSNMNGDAVARMLHGMPKTANIPIILYQEGEQDVPDSRFVREGTGICKFVRSSDGRVLVQAVEEVLRRQAQEKANQP